MMNEWRRSIIVERRRKVERKGRKDEEEREKILSRAERDSQV